MRKNTGRDLTVGNPFRLILAFAVPIILGNLFQQFYNLVDTVIVGRFLGMEALAGVGATGSLNFLVIGFCNGVGSGFVIPVANRYGAKDYKDLRKFLGNAVFLSGILAVVLTTIVSLSTRPILTLLNTPADIIDYSYSYILVIFLGIPATLAYNLLAGAVRSIGDSKTPLYLLLISCAINLGLDYLFIVPLHLGVTGAALATVLSQVVCVIFLIIVILKKYQLLIFRWVDLKPSRKNILFLLNMGIPMGLQYSITAIGSVIMTASVNTLGSIAVASVTAAGKITILFACPLDALGSALATYGSQNLGAGKPERIGRGLRDSAVIGCVYSVVSFAVLLLIGKDLIRLFVTDPSADLIRQANQYLLVTGAFFVTLVFVNLIRFLIQGLGFATLAILSGLMEMIARAITGLVLVPLLGFTGATISSPLAWILADAFLFPAYFIIMKKLLTRYGTSECAKDYPIVPATDADREEILALYKSQLGLEYCPWNEDYPTDREISFDLSRDSLYVMKDGVKIIAAISVEQDENVDALPCWSASGAPGGELARLCVAPSMQNRGLARKMLEFGMAELKRRDFHSLHFLVNKNNVKALKSYAVFGFDLVGECHMYEQDYLCYEKIFDPR